MLVVSVNLLQLPLISIEKISAFNVSCYNSVIMQKEALKPHKLYLIAIFPNECFPCNKNRFLLNKMSKQNELISYGIFLNEEMYYKFNNIGLLNFKTYYPTNPQSLIQGIKINSKNTYTIISKGATILYKKEGNLHYQDVKKINEIIRRNYE